MQLIGITWNVLFAAKRLFENAGYTGGVRVLVNLVGTKDSYLVQFAKPAAPDGRRWFEPFEMQGMMAGSITDWRCRDGNLQFEYGLVVSSFDEGQAKKLILQCADGLTLAYNHQSSPRCFRCGSDEFPWEQFDANHV